MKLLVDMNLSPNWVAEFQSFEALAAGTPVTIDPGPKRAPRCASVTSLVAAESAPGGMTFWLDAQLPPALARSLIESFGVEAQPLRALRLRDATDREIFDAARRAGVTIMIMRKVLNSVLLGRDWYSTGDRR